MDLSGIEQPGVALPAEARPLVQRSDSRLGLLPAHLRRIKQHLVYPGFDMQAQGGAAASGFIFCTIGFSLFIFLFTKLPYLA